MLPDGPLAASGGGCDLLVALALEQEQRHLALGRCEAPVRELLAHRPAEALEGLRRPFAPLVSLALALGLADVITDEAGGTDLDTLFVDEGFGSLDSETLEDVMDTLDTLRDGGRVVGVVSHVPELQTRIPTQLRVPRGRHGSHTSLSLG